MTSARTAIAALLLLSGATSAKAQDPAGTVPGGSTATGQTEPAPGEQIVRPKRGRLIDLIKAIAPPLIEAASSRPPPQGEPVPQPVAPIPPAAPAAMAPAPAQTGTVIVPPPPRPRPVQAEPRPSAPRQPTTAAPRPAPPVGRPAPRPPLAAPTQVLVPLPSTPAPSAAEPSPPPPVAQTVTPSSPVEPETPAIRWGSPLIALFGIVAAIAALAGAHRLRRMRRIAWTRAALALEPRLDPAAGASSISGLSLTGPPLSIRARLLAADHG